MVQVVQIPCCHSGVFPRTAHDVSSEGPDRVPPAAHWELAGRLLAATGAVKRRKNVFFLGGKMEQTRVEVVVLRYFEQIQFFWFFLAVFVLFWKHLDAGAASAIRSIDVEYLFCVDIAQAIIDLLMQPMQVQSVHNMGVLDETAQTSVGLVIIWIGRSRRDLRQPRAQSSVWATVKELGIHWVPRGHFDVHPTHCCAEDITTPRP